MKSFLWSHVPNSHHEDRFSLTFSQFIYRGGGGLCPSGSSLPLYYSWGIMFCCHACMQCISNCLYIWSTLYQFDSVHLPLQWLFLFPPKLCFYCPYRLVPIYTGLQYDYNKWFFFICLVILCSRWSSLQRLFICNFFLVVAWSQGKTVSVTNLPFL